MTYLRVFQNIWPAQNWEIPVNLRLGRYRQKVAQKS